MKAKLYHSVFLMVNVVRNQKLDCSVVQNEKYVSGEPVSSQKLRFSLLTLPAVCGVRDQVTPEGI